MEAAQTEKERLLSVTPDMQTLTLRYFDAICLDDRIASRAIAAFRKVGLTIVS